MESSTQLPSTSTSTAKNFEYEYWYWKMYSSTSTVKKFEYEYFYKFRERNFSVVTAQNLRKNINEYVFFCEWDVKKAQNCRRQFSDKLHAKLLLYFKQIRYLGVESKCAFFCSSEKTLACRSSKLLIVVSSSVTAAEKCLTLKLSEELTWNFW